MSLDVAQTILEQLGGGRFIAMTGARQFVGDESALTFRIPTSRGPDAETPVNRVQIRLDHATDTYTMTLSRVSGLHRVQVVAVLDGVYAEDLQRIFTAYTGLYTHL